MNANQAGRILGSLFVAAMVAGAMAVAGAPTWAWLGLGLIVYLLPGHEESA